MMRSDVLGPVTYGKDPYEIAEGADAVVWSPSGTSSARSISSA
jgi:hypothetical protein